MNLIVKKILLIGFLLLLTACVHYPSRPAYYAAPAYRSAYVIEQRSYYGPSPQRYERHYRRPDRVYLPRPSIHHQHNISPRWHNNAPKQQHERERPHEGRKNRR